MQRSGAETISGRRNGKSRVALQRPAVLLCFDLLKVAGEDLTSLPLSDRRHRLEHLVAGLHPCLQLMIQTDVGRSLRIG